MLLSLLSASAGANAVCALLNSGYARFYTAPRRASPQAAVGAAQLLAECRFPTTAFQPAASGVALANPLTDEDATLAAGAVAWCALYRSDGSTAVADCSVGPGDLDPATSEGFDLEIADVNLLAGRRFGVTSLRYIHPLGA